MRNYQFYILLLTLTMTSCGRKSVREYYDSGKLKVEFSVNDRGQKNGSAIGYFENGRVQWESYYTNGVLDGKMTEYRSNGKKCAEGLFSKGVQSGQLITYWENGGIKSKSYYVNGKENGESLYYYQNGQLKMKAFFINSQPQFYSEYDSLGNVIDKKHLIHLQILGEPIKNDSLRINVKIYGLPINKSVFTWLGKLNVEKEMNIPEMSFDETDSTYTYSFPPIEDTGQHVIHVRLLLEGKFASVRDSLIVVKEKRNI